MKYDIYWGNALFSDADRFYNAECVEKLRNLNLVVYLPQESPENKKKSPGEVEIFTVDTEAIKDSKIIVMCIDQDPIDSGVACEIGVCYGLKKVILGLFTDIRKDRERNKVYKNPYIIGAIKATGGEIAESFAELEGMIFQKIDYRASLR